jgi:hypothetical protein
MGTLEVLPFSNHYDNSLQYLSIINIPRGEGREECLPLHAVIYRVPESSYDKDKALSN